MIEIMMSHEKVEKGELQVGNEHLPRLSVDILYTSHRTAQDVKKLERMMKEADVYVFSELGGWDYRFFGLIKNVSEGEILPEAALKKVRITAKNQPSYYYALRKQLRLLFNTKKPVAAIDYSRGDPLLGELKKLYRLIGVINIQNKAFTTILEERRKFYSEIGQLLQSREQYQYEQIRALLPKLVEEFPSLKEKDQIRILTMMGAVHTGVYHKLKSDGVNTRREFGKMPFFYNVFIQILRRNLFGKPVNNEILAKVLFLELIFSEVIVIQKLTRDSTKFSLYFKILTDTINYTTMKEIYESSRSLEELKRKLKEFMSEQGLTVPQNEQELDRMIFSSR